MTRVNQQRKVYDVLKDEIGNPVHALSITTRTPEQWQKSQQVNQSPACLGKRDEPIGAEKEDASKESKNDDSNESKSG